MNDYPPFPILLAGYRQNIDYGRTGFQAQDGTPWIQERYSAPVGTFNPSHMMRVEEYSSLLSFYASNKMDYIRFVDPETGDSWRVLFSADGEPKITERKGAGWLVVSSTLIGRKI